MIRRILLLLGILSLPTMAQAEWHKAVTNHFEIYADENAAWLHDYAEKLERYDSAARQLRGLPDDAGAAARRVTVYLVPRAEFGNLAPKGIGGFYSGRATGSVIFMPGRENDEVLFHEYTHHQLALAWAGIAIPGWLNEGMAQVQSTAEFRPDGSVVFGRELEYVQYMLADMDTSEMTKMLSKTTVSTGDVNYYSIGWLLTHMLTFSDKRAGELPQYIVAVNKGQTLEEAAETAFGGLRKLGSDLQKYRRASSLPGVVIPADRITIGPIEVTKLTPGGAATILDTMHSRAGVDEEKAAELYGKAIKDAEPYPDDAGAQRMLAEAAFDAHAFQTAYDAAERAIAADAATAGAHYYKALAMRELGMEAEEQRAVIDEGLRHRPDDPALMQLYYNIYAESDQPVPLIAKTYLVAAYQLAPQDPELRFRTGHMLLAEGKPDQARAVLRPLAFSVHRSKTAERALAAITAIEDGDVELALAELQKAEEEDEAQEGESADE